APPAPRGAERRAPVPGAAVDRLALAHRTVRSDQLPRPDDALRGLQRAPWALSAPVGPSGPPARPDAAEYPSGRAPPRAARGAEPLRDPRGSRLAVAPASADAAHPGRRISAAGNAPRAPRAAARWSTSRCA